MKKLRLILGDQLNSEHSWFSEKDKNTVYLMAEMRQETDYVKHHIQKVVAFFMSMRNFATFLQSSGHEVIYIKILNEENVQNLEDIISSCIEKNKIELFEYQLPDEYRLDEQLKSICNQLKIPSKVYDTEHFFTQRNDVANFFEGKKQLLMENFYRDLRKKHHYLMNGSKPEGSIWNLDKDNRLKYKGQVIIPKPAYFISNVGEIVKEIEVAGIPTFGSIDTQKFVWPTSRQESLEQLDYFCKNLLVHFGDYEDAMHTDEKYLFHSRLSFAMNSKMLSPKKVVEAAISAYNKSHGEITLSQIEGFVRQILGWREYIRGIYWKEMPDYNSMNALENFNKLPNFYWTGKTKMNCMQKSISQSLTDAYAHHIQRLMIIGNFSLLTQMHPDEVDAWYLGVYIDAIEWVELPNTRGMSQYADGGIVATKPYVSSGSYINKMSNYCSSCHYSVKEKFGENACPFNSLYWNFLDDKKIHFKNNQRVSMMLNLLNKIPAEDLFQIKNRAQHIIENLDKY